MFAKGQQKKDYSAKTEVQKTYPQSLCKRNFYSGFGAMYAVYENPTAEIPLIVRRTAEKAWEDLLETANSATDFRE